MFTEMNRPYRKTRRAEAQEATRQRIIDAAIALHEELGPSKTTISAIADRAGVQRLTVYRYFPDDRSLLEACSSGWMELNPPPSVDIVGQNKSPEEHLRGVLAAWHRYYRSAAPMLRSVFRDASFMPEVAERLDLLLAGLQATADDLVAASGKSGLAGRVSIAHALAFTTWADLAERGLSDDQITDLTVRWIEAAA